MTDPEELSRKTSTSVDGFPIAPARTRRPKGAEKRERKAATWQLFVKHGRKAHLSFDPEIVGIA